MKIRQQRARAGELKAGIDEQIGLPRERVGAVRTLAMCTLQSPDARRAHRHQAPRRVHLRCVLLRDAVVLGVQPRRVELFRVDGLKRAQSHMQRDVRDLRARRPAALQNLRREVQARRGRGDGAFFPREHGLVALTIHRSYQPA